MSVRELLPLTHPFKCDCGETTNKALIERANNNEIAICQRCDKSTPVRVYTPIKGDDLCFRLERR